MNDDRITPAMARFAYAQGYFPMAESDHGPIHWYYPTMRCLMPIEGIRVSRSLARTLRRSPFRVTYDESFREVMTACRRPEGNWISPELIDLYTEIHDEGWAHSCEVWEDDRLVGGVYGLALGSCFSGESMFHRATDASKVALYHLVNHVRELGFIMFDAQFINDHTASLGAYEITQREYLARLEVALQTEVPWR
jgi:leucyl/phenylalanyl-tRNA--protein transferase